MIELIGVSKAYAGTTALEPVSILFQPRKTYALVGPSGCGKSTLLRLIMGLLKPDSGTVSLGGETMSPVNQLVLRRRMGYVIQSGGLFPHLTAGANVALVPRFVGWDRARIRRRTDELADLTRFPRAGLKRFPAQLSGGQQQRVSLMRALVLDPDVLLLDEPLGALDPMIRSELQVELRDIFRSLGKTVVLVTHDMAEAAYFGDQILLMRDGRVVQQGEFAELIESPAEDFVGQFINAQRALPS